jgi:hypothetical protein
MERSARARALLVAALAEVEAELATPRYRLHAEELGTCRETLARYLASLDADDLPPRRDRAEGLGKLVADRWPYDVPLADVVRRAERAWRIL